jgi:hypothetical protein
MEFCYDSARVPEDPGGLNAPSVAEITRPVASERRPGFSCLVLLPFCYPTKRDRMKQGGIKGVARFISPNVFGAI